MHFATLFVTAATAVLTSAQDVPTLAAALNSTASLSSLLSLISGYPDLLTTLANSRNITIFAPSNDAIAELVATPGWEELAAVPGYIEAVLTYHVVNASLSSANFTASPLFVPTLQSNQTYANVTGGQRIGLVLAGDDDDDDDAAASAQVLSGLGQSAAVTTADIVVSTGYVHIIDSVLTLPLPVSSTALAANLTAIAGALALTNLTGTVDTTADLTIFAPTDQAFEAIANILATVDAATLTSVLTYHVVAGTVGYSSLLENGAQLEALSGQQLNITIDEGEVFVNSARVIAANILVAGGVVHLIDSVLNPNSTNVVNTDDDDESAANFPDASSGALAFTSDIPTATASAAVATTDAVLPSDYTTPQAGGATSATVATTAVTASDGGAASMPTGAMGAAALFGGAALLANF